MPPPAEQFVARFLVGPTLRTQSDRRLVKLVRDGYEAAFEEIVRRYGSPLRRCAARIVGRNAEDVTQDAFSKALLALRRDENEIELRPWLFRIVRNTALNDLRDRPPSAEALAETLVAGGRGPAEELERREELADLMRRLGALPEPQRAAIVMRELEGLGHEEIAAALGLSGGGARQAIYRARQALREGLGMLLPLPLLKGLMSGGVAGPAEAAAGAAGVGGALKASAATVLVVGAVGAGVALDSRHEHRPPPARAATPHREDRLAVDGPLASSRVDGTHVAESSHETAREGFDGATPETPAGGVHRGHDSGGGPEPGSNPDGEDRGGHGPGRGGGDTGESSHGGSDDDPSGSSGHGSGGDDGGGDSGPDEDGLSTSGEGTSSGEGSGPSGSESSNSGSSEDSGPGGGGGGQTSEDLGDPQGSLVFSEQ